MSTISKTNITVNRPLGAEGEHVRPRRLTWAGPLTAVAATAATAATIAVREIGVAVGTIPPDVQILQEPMVAISTIAYILLGTLIFAGIARFASRPVRTFRIVAVTALVLSLLNPIAAGAGWIPVGAAIGVATMVTMMVMHVVAALISIYLLPRLVLER